MGVRDYLMIMMMMMIMLTPFQRNVIKYSICYGKAIGFMLGKLAERDQDDRRKGRAKGGNRREPNLKREIKESRQIVAELSNELHRRRKRRKATKKE